MISYQFLVFSLLIGVTVASGATCDDRGTPQYCQDNKEFCDDPFGSDTRYYCKKTCGLCSGSTTAPGSKFLLI
ncbi:hypothetical protein CRE_26111 [Caenorhabditis remanei]|uniref:ShKT domain-containing protein n=1 Tax=Caenorhabditis remanei TaxID=31234 RepID=E3LQ91_CAERE|nr:hypothetical protein CRE_26111 [Caenorhabditis remanei]